ncbi:MAG: glutamate 5-kinase [Candidatus Omnitrophota bacterium]
MKKSDLDYKLIVVKLGSSVIVSASGGIDHERLRNIVFGISDLYEKGKSVVLVSSGAIACGMSLLGLQKRPKEINQLQAVASIGQIELMSLYSRLFNEKKRHCSQVLLTWDDFNNRVRYINAKHTLFSAVKYNSVPIINENDAVSTDEIKFGDNDRLSALVANLIDADLLVILSDVDGLYRQNEKEVIKVVERLDASILKMVSDGHKEACVGGMSSKLEAIRIATQAGIPSIIANGKTDGILNKIMDNDYLGTFFLPKTKGLVAKKRWIAYGTKPKGKIIVDKGARVALSEKNKSLLCVGITDLSGDFQKGDIVMICEEKMREFARGISNYSALELKKAKKGSRLGKEVVHRDNLVII